MAWFRSTANLLLVIAGSLSRPAGAERITAAEAGYSEEGLRVLEQVLAESGSESMLLLLDGKVFFEWGDSRRRRLVHSIRKPLLHALIGVELGRGNDCLAPDRTVADHGLDERPPGLTANEKSATFRQLLQTRSGVYHPAAAEADSMAAARPARGSHAPGTHYYYNNWDFNCPTNGSTKARNRFRSSTRSTGWPTDSFGMCWYRVRMKSGCRSSTPAPACTCWAST